MSSKSIQEKMREKFQNRSGASPHDILMGELNKQPESDEDKKENEEPEVSDDTSKDAPKHIIEKDKQPQRKVKTEKEVKQTPKGSYRRQKAKFVERYTQQSIYIENNLLEALGIVLGWGERTAFANVAIRNLLLSEDDIVSYLEENHKELLDIIKKTEYTS